MSMPSLFYIGSYEMIVVQVLLLAGVIGAITAKAKGRSGLIWFVLSVVSCGAGILVVLFMPVKKPQQNKAPGTKHDADASR
ncbi:hypothetical protein SAMN04488056_10343 [Cohaesibacter marisflavi]|uniref:Uncharacterized protein n=1 Tax=Cohaesibacter marisflavi TaxID=655353 RepID=A0A1I5E5X0_9HYPH|nr:hypothetical protein [Cohaesibacter marisflavi]SFO06776.1 hypothetical protein SAMN04488056_10343 [Cohaesibacter marisflavi]